MKVLALIFALTLAGKIQYSHSQVREANLKKVLLLPRVSVLMFRILVDVFPKFDVSQEDKGKFDNYVTCVKNTKMAHNGTVCPSMHIGLNECFKPLAEVSQKLLPENAKYLAQLSGDSLWQQLEYACNAKDEELSELANVCIMEKLPYDVFNEEYYQQHKKEQLETYKATPTKANLCKAMRHFAPMYTDPVKATCENEATVKAFNGFIEASFKLYCD